ncbi:hypothetical protein [Paenibacillus tengchongensis]|uniref:hypothetical protein n=1 Tax=Paenibacillus tengchongensis TaxID=2608684 RepID=UPI00124C9BBF|nr:hypothetical protein [Paenibacillus tengchongensis]
MTKKRAALIVLILGFALTTACAADRNMEQERQDDYALPYNYAGRIKSHISYLRSIFSAETTMNEIKSVSKGYSFSFDNSSVYEYLTSDMTSILDKTNDEMSSEAGKSVELLTKVTGTLLEITRSGSFENNWTDIEKDEINNLLTKMDPQTSVSSTTDLTLYNLFQNAQGVVNNSSILTVNSYLKDINENLQFIYQKLSDILHG